MRQRMCTIADEVAHARSNRGIRGSRQEERAEQLVRRSLMNSGVEICQHTSAYVSIRIHLSAYVSIRQHTSAYVSIRIQHTRTYAVYSIRPRMLYTYADRRIQHTYTAYSIRPRRARQPHE